MTTINLGDLQRVYRARENRKIRDGLRHYLLGRGEPSPGIFIIVSRRLYANGQIDNLGLSDAWIASSTETERATLFSQIVTRS
jgi:hypothetical protein